MYLKFVVSGAGADAQQSRFARGRLSYCTEPDDEQKRKITKEDDDDDEGKPTQFWLPYRIHFTEEVGWIFISVNKIELTLAFRIQYGMSIVF